MYRNGGVQTVERGGAGRSSRSRSAHLRAIRNMPAPRERPNPDRFAKQLERPLAETNMEMLDTSFRRLHLRDMRDVEGQVLFFRSQPWLPQARLMRERSPHPTGEARPHSGKAVAYGRTRETVDARAQPAI